MFDESKIEYIKEKSSKAEDILDRNRYRGNRSPQQIPEKYINRYLIPVNKLNDDFKSILVKNDLEKRKFLQSHFLNITDNSFQLTSLLYHLYYDNTESLENLHYIRYIVPNCNNELGLIWVIKLEWERLGMIWNNHLIRSFDNPNFSEFAFGILNDFLQDDFSFEQEMEDWSDKYPKYDQELDFYVSHLSDYLWFCCVQNRFDEEKVKKIYKNLGNKFKKDNYHFTRGLIQKNKYSIKSVSEDMNIKVHLRDLQLYRESDKNFIDGYFYNENQYYNGESVGKIKPYPSKLHTYLLNHRQKRSKIEWRKNEQQIRVELGLPKIGEQWVSETSIYYLVKKLLHKKNVNVIHHYRPKFLERKELDIYFEYDGIKVGIEYQGKQHFEPIDFFGGVEGFKDVQKRDKDKKNQCEKNGINLIYINYFENISEKLLINKLRTVLPSLF